MNEKTSASRNDKGAMITATSGIKKITGGYEHSIRKI